MLKDVLRIENRLTEIEKELLDLAKPKYFSHHGVKMSSGLNVIRYEDSAWEKTEFLPDSGSGGKRDADRFDVLARSAAVTVGLPGRGEPRERFLNGLLSYARASASGSLQIFPRESESPFSFQIFDLASISANYVRHLATQLYETQKTESREEPSIPGLGVFPETLETPTLTRVGTSSWRLDFRGASLIFPNRVGLQFLAELMRRPSQNVPALELLQVVCAGTDTVDVREAEVIGLKQDAWSGDRDGVETFDSRAIEESRKRIEELREEMDEAREFGNHAEVAAKQEEIDQIAHLLVSGLDKNGRSRKLGSEAEKARVSVTKAINRALETVQENHPDAAVWLRARIQTGGTCRFSPTLPRAT